MAPNQYVRHVVIHRRELRDAPASHHRKPERSAKRRVHRKLFDELAGYRELDQFAWLVRISVDGVVLRRDQMAIRRHDHSQWAVQVRVILVDYSSRAMVA